MKVHFMGIGGSGMSGVALIAKARGYEVTGCDLENQNVYIEKLKKEGVPVLIGHNADHLDEGDLLVVTPAAYYQNKNHPEIKKAKAQRRLITWQEFLGKFLHKNQKVICIAGTHGKSTTTAMIGLLLERAGLDPSVVIGANVKEWNANFRVGAGEYFVTEADEFYDNFLNYEPNIIILNNIEFDHPDYFKNEKAILESFKKFILRLKEEKVLIYNQDDIGIKKLFRIIPQKTLESMKLIGYSTSVKNLKLDKKVTRFSTNGEEFQLKILGKYNVLNALGVIKTGSVLKISPKVIKKVISSFNGIARRMELIGKPRGVFVYDDYAHHPTAIRETLKGLRQRYPHNKIWAIVEPHTFSRTKALLPLYKGCFKDADKVVIAPIFKSRDSNDFGIDGNSIVSVANHKSISYIDSFDKIVDFLKANIQKSDVIIIMGAGVSYKLARDLVQKI